jgi:cytochrome c oxidase cbb3-type subunit 4
VNGHAVNSFFSTLIGIFTALLIVVFIGIVAWAWSSARRQSFDAAARLPLEEDRHPGTDVDQEPRP